MGDSGLITPARRRFERLLARPYADAVIAANRAYLGAALPAAADGAGQRWVLTCLPSTRTRPGRRRLSVVSMRNMETFVLYVDDREPTTPRGFVVVSQSAALSAFGTPEALRAGLNLEEVYPSTYQAAGHDQLALTGTAEDLIRVLGDPTIAEAAGELADDLTTSRSVYARFHNTHLTDAVLARTVHKGRPGMTR